jgi:glycosyltransferase involved in cell wall biosynthesis
VSTTLSVVIPAYNEERFIGTLLERIRAVDLAPLGVTAEIIVVDDGSKDRTVEIASRVPGVRVHRMPVNGGKGKAVRAGIELAAGDLQDNRGDVVYGSRYLGRGRHANQSMAAYFGGRSLSLVALVFTGTYLTDTVTAYKLFHRTDLAALALETSGFELDHEITARLLARGRRIVEVPISYHPRSREEGKKIGPKDWVTAIRTFARFRNG